MAHKFSDNSFIDCGTGISVPSDAEVEMRGNQFIRCRRAVEVREPTSLLEALGLAKDTPLAVVRDLLTAMPADSSNTRAIAAEVQRSGILSWLATGANVTTVVTGLASLLRSGLVQAALKMLQG